MYVYTIHYTKFDIIEQVAQVLEFKLYSNSKLYICLICILACNCVQRRHVDIYIFKNGTFLVLDKAHISVNYMDTGPQILYQLCEIPQVKGIVEQSVESVIPSVRSVQLPRIGIMRMFLFVVVAAVGISLGEFSLFHNTKNFPILITI